MRFSESAAVLAAAGLVSALVTCTAHVAASPGQAPPGATALEPKFEVVSVKLFAGNGGPVAVAGPGARLRQLLSHRNVIDKTGLEGTYSFEMIFAPEQAAAASDLPSLYTALQEQLGLKLESDRGRFACSRSTASSGRPKTECGHWVIGSSGH